MYIYITIWTVFIGMFSEIFVLKKSLICQNICLNLTVQIMINVFPVNRYEYVPAYVAPFDYVHIYEFVIAQQLPNL